MFWCCLFVPFLKASEYLIRMPSLSLSALAGTGNGLSKCGKLNLVVPSKKCNRRTALERSVEKLLVCVWEGVGWEGLDFSLSKIVSVLFID